ncbi:MAG: hypothetical protein JRF06_06625 [Deltaproteobacteria bacterium]|nr:hypothetical protein [Deltaproteobacteria bacterium]
MQKSVRDYPTIRVRGAIRVKEVMNCVEIATRWHKLLKHLLLAEPCISQAIGHALHNLGPQSSIIHFIG